MTDYGFISDAWVSLALLLGQDLRKPQLNARALSLVHVASNGPVTFTPDRADSQLRRTR